MVIIFIYFLFSCASQFIECNQCSEDIHSTTVNNILDDNNIHHFDLENKNILDDINKKREKRYWDVMNQQRKENNQIEKLKNLETKGGFFNIFDDSIYENLNSEADYEEAVVEYTPDGKFKVIPLSRLNNQQLAALRDWRKNEMSASLQQDDRYRYLPDYCNKTVAELDRDKLRALKKRLMERRKERLRCQINSGITCKPNGVWFSPVAGLRVNMQVNTTGKMALAFSDADPPVCGRLNKEWVGKGISPFPRGGPFGLTVWNAKKKEVAVFVGQCRVCNYSPSIMGWWLFAKQARSCRDVLLSGQLHSDMFQKQPICIVTTRCSQTKPTQTTKIATIRTTPFLPKPKDIYNKFNVINQ